MGQIRLWICSLISRLCHLEYVIVSSISGRFELTAVMFTEPHYATRETMVVSSGDVNAEAMPHYAMLRVWNDEMEKQWPAVNT